MSLRISIVMPTKNANAFVARAVNSFSSQSWSNKQLVLVDGGSDDGTVETVQRLLGRNDVLHVQADRNATEAVNRGVGLSDGDVIALLMSDDWLEPGALEVIARAFTSDPRADLVCGGARLWSAARDGEKIEDAVSAKEDRALSLERLLGVPYMAAYSFRRRVWTAMDGFGVDYRYGADRDFLVRCRLANLRVKAVDPFVYNYLRHEGSATLNDRDDVVQEFLADHRVMSARWLKRSDLSESVRAEILAWRRGETLALADRQIMGGKYREVAMMLAMELFSRPALAIAGGRRIVAHMRRRVRRALVR
ncbi:MAG: glycosyltransferase [Novosphingobium sp.]|nr:glycosyltransferase [Novosphingobium sp.]